MPSPQKNLLLCGVFYQNLLYYQLKLLHSLMNGEHTHTLSPWSGAPSGMGNTNMLLQDK